MTYDTEYNPATNLPLATAIPLSATLENRASTGKPSTPQTFGELFAHYLEHHARAHKDEAMYQLHIAVHLSALPLPALRAQHISVVLTAARRHGLTTQANRLFSLIRCVLHHGSGLGWLNAALVLQGLKRPVAEVPRERHLQHQELEQIVRALWPAQNAPATSKVTAAAQLALQFLLLTGQRVGEVAGIAKAEIDLAVAVWSLPAARAKNKKSHKVPLTADALMIIRQAIALSPDCPWLFPSPIARQGRPSGVQPITSTSLNHAFSRLLKGSTVADVHLHDLREAAATTMAELGVPVRHIAAVLNHSQASITERAYIRHSFAAEKRAALEQWAAHIDRLKAQGEPGSYRLNGGGLVSYCPIEARAD